MAIITNSTTKIFESFQNKTSHSNSFTRIGVIFSMKVKSALSYKSSFFMVVALNLVTILMYFFFSRLNPDMTIFGMSATYFEFAFVGLALQMIVGTSLSTVNGNIYNEILSGTWPSILIHFNIVEYALGTSLAGVALSSISIFVAVFIGTLFLGLEFHFVFRELILIILLLILILLSHIVISMLFSAYCIWYKKNSGLVALIYRLSKTFSGIVFPIVLLTGFTGILSKTLPLTYGLQSIHEILYASNANFNLILYNFLILLGFIIIIGVLSCFLVSKSIKRSKITGSVGWY